jgi:hypothetical protein
MGDSDYGDIFPKGCIVIAIILMLVGLSTLIYLGYKLIFHG